MLNFWNKIIAEANASSLLYQFVSEYQIVQLILHQYLDIVGSEGNLYRVETGGVGVHSHLLNGFGEKSQEWWCVMPDYTFVEENGDIPDFDQILTQKLWLESDEYDYMLTAHWHPNNCGRRF